MNARSLLIAFGVALLSQSPAFAITISFNQTEVPGITNGTPVTDQWQSFGIDVSNAHWYQNSSLDPFDGMGIQNTGATGQVHFLSPIDSVFVQWAQTNNSDGLFIEVFTAADLLNPLDSFASPGNDLSGSATLTGSDIAFLQWHDAGSQVAISTLAFPVLPVNNVPEPESLGLVGLALVGLAVFGRRRAA